MLSCEFKSFTPKDDRLIGHYINDSSEQSHQMAYALADGMGITVPVVFQRAFQIGCIKYTPYSAYLLSHRRDGYRSDEVNTLILNRHLNRKRLAHMLDRSPSSVNKQMYCFRLMRHGDDYSWSEDEVSELRRLANDYAVNVIAHALNRTPIDVKHRAIEEQIWLHQSSEAFTSRRKTHSDKHIF